MDEDELYTYAKEIGAPHHLLKQTAEVGRLPVVNFAAGGVATPADAALMMQLGARRRCQPACLPAPACRPSRARPRAGLGSGPPPDPSAGMDGVFVGSGIFKSDNPAKRARAIVEAVANYNDPKVLARVSEDLGAPMVGINCEDMTVSYAAREGGNNAAAPAAANGKSPHGTW